MSTDITTLDAFTRQYIETALWSSTDQGDDQGGEPLDANYTAADLADETLRRIVADCRAFQNVNADTLADLDIETAGHDFWLTRNLHGAGFWDGDYAEPVAGILTESSKRFGETDLYVGDDGSLYLSGGAGDPHAFCRWIVADYEGSSYIVPRVGRDHHLDAHLTDVPDDAHAYAYLLQDGGSLACFSSYGRITADCAPIALTLCKIMSALQGETMTYHGLALAQVVVVNDSDDVAYTIVSGAYEMGPDFNPVDIIGEDGMARAEEYRRANYGEDC